MTGLRVPPGRAGRVWLRRRSELAATALARLEQKCAVLDRKRVEADIRAAQTARDWAVADALAREWLTRAALLSGTTAVERACPGTPARVRIEWSSPAGVRQPSVVTAVLPQDFSGTVGSGSALVAARDAYAAALRAALEHAVAATAQRAVTRELAAARTRVLALRRRRIPQLAAALAAVELELAERERADRSAAARAAGADR